MAGAPDLDFRRQLFAWLASHDEAYYDDDLQPYANVALLFSRQTLDYLDKGSWDSEHAYHDEWEGMAVILLPLVSHDEVVVRVINYVDVNTGDAAPTPQNDLSLTLTLPAGQSATAGELLDYLGDVQPLSFPVPTSPDVQVTFDLDISAVLSFTITIAWPCQIPGDLDCDVDVMDIMIVASL